MTKKDYRIFEGLRVAILTTFISGFINAYTYNTQGGLFAGVQTGNVLMMMIRFSQGEISDAFRYALPIVIFTIGQFVTYHVREWCHRHGLHWHQFGAGILFFLMIFLAVISPEAPEYVMTAGLAMFASIQVDTFKRVRGLAYANLMMTGNIKNGAQMLARGLAEKDKELQKQAFYTYSAIFSFMIGVMVSTFMTDYLYEYALLAILFPISILVYILLREKTT